MERKITKKQIAGVIFLFILLISLPIAIYLTRQNEEIRPRAALAGAANFKLDSSNLTPLRDQTFNVSAKLDVTDPNVRVSGVDFRILYDKNLLFPNPTIIAATGSGKPFTDMLVSEVDQPYSENLNSLHIVLVSRRLTPALFGGNDIPLATITFTAKEDGPAVIKYPDQNADQNGVPLMEVVGIDLRDEPTPTPTTTGVNPTNTPACFAVGHSCSNGTECCSGACVSGSGGRACVAN